MQVRIIGNVRDVTGFGLAGVAGVVCDSSAEAASALKRAVQEPGVAVILVSASAAAAVAHAAAPDASAPLIVVLPAAGSTQGGGAEKGTP